MLFHVLFERLGSSRRAWLIDLHQTDDSTVYSDALKKALLSRGMESWEEAV